MACAATRRTQDADGSSWVLHGHHVISVSTTRERDEGGGCGCGWVRAAADGVRTFPAPDICLPVTVLKKEFTIQTLAAMAQRK